MYRTRMPRCPSFHLHFPASRSPSAPDRSPCDCCCCRCRHNACHFGKLLLRPSNRSLCPRPLSGLNRMMSCDWPRLPPSESYRRTLARTRRSGKTCSHPLVAVAFFISKLFVSVPCPLQLAAYIPATVATSSLIKWLLPLCKAPHSR